MSHRLFVAGVREGGTCGDTPRHLVSRATEGQVKQERQGLQSDTVNAGLLKWRCYSNIQRGAAFEHMECIYIYYVLKFHISLAVEGYSASNLSS